LPKVAIQSDYKQFNFGDFGSTGNFGNCEFMKDLKD